jgi:hypothetical protein
MMAFARAVALAVTLAVGLTGCGAAPTTWTDTPFQRTASDAASTFAAAAELLERSHTRSLTLSYMRGAFENFSEVLEGVDAALPTLEGRPDDDTVVALVEAFGQAKAAIDGPCVDSDCDWAGQTATIRHAASAFAEAAQ